jgi:single-strand DNA-binding protein
MDTMNKVFLMGRLGQDPQTHMDKKGMSFVRLSLATNKRIKSGDKDEEKKPDWHTVLVWGQRADTCAKYLKKGSPVFVEGFLSTYNKPRGEGHNEWKSTIRAVNISFLPGGQPRSNVDLGMSRHGGALEGDSEEFDDLSVSH